MGGPLYQVDAFSEQPFGGNPAAVVPLDAPASESWMQRFAAEMNLSETAFYWPEGATLRLRWFAPLAEVSLCGHATLASAHVLWESGGLALTEPARFETLSGRLTCKRADDGRIEMEFPARPTTRVDDVPGLGAALGVAPRWIGRNADDYLVEVASASEVRAATPDFATLARLPVRGVCLTAVSDGGHGGHGCDFVSRFFAPAVGVPEDPVTGSAHCALALFWSERLGRESLVGYQASARGGIVGVRVAGDRVVLSGRAVTILRGKIAVVAGPT